MKPVCATISYGRRWSLPSHQTLVRQASKENESLPSDLLYTALDSKLSPATKLNSLLLPWPPPLNPRSETTRTYKSCSRYLDQFANCRTGKAEKMGNAQSPPHGDPHFASTSRAFTHTELEDLKSLLESLAAQSHSDGQFISPSVFQTYLGLHGPLGDRMFDLVTQQRKDQKLTFEDLVVAKGTYEKGTRDDIEEFIYKLLDINGDGVLGRAYLNNQVELSVAIMLCDT